MFDTGFVAYFRGWSSLREEDRGYLLEHLVLAELQARFLRSSIFYWRDKAKHEIDFALKAGRGAAITAIECKASQRAFDLSGLAAFRRKHPKGTNLLVCLDAVERTTRSMGGLEIQIVPYGSLGDELGELPGLTTLTG
jgi:predicted AAA+ superfamily ATPase